MWESAAFENVGAGPAGGFLNTTNNFSSPSKFQDNKKQTDRITNIVPCTVAQIFKVPETEEHLKISQISAHIITIVGFVQAVDHQPTRVTYLIDDLSGKPIEAQFWVADDASNQAENISVKSYVRVTGALRSLRGKRHIIIFKIQHIADLNELTMHLLEVIHTSMTAALMARQTMMHPDNVPLTHAAGSLSAFSGNTAENTSFGCPYTLQGLNKPQQMVLQCINTCKDEHGLTITDIVNKLRSLNQKIILDAIEFLSNEGHIYSTIDDDHYKSTNSG